MTLCALADILEVQGWMAARHGRLETRYNIILTIYVERIVYKFTLKIAQHNDYDLDLDVSCYSICDRNAQRDGSQQINVNNKY